MGNPDDLRKRIEWVVSELEEISRLLEEDSSDPTKAVQFGQVKEIEATIARLQRQGLSVPNELKELKIRLFSMHENYIERIALNQKLQQSLRKFIKPQIEPKTSRAVGEKAVQLSSRNPSNYQRPLGSRGFEHLSDYLIPIIKLMWNGHKHTEAFHIIANKLDVRYNTVNAQCTRTLNITTDEFIKQVESKAIVTLLERKFPDQYQKIKTELKS